MTDDEPSDDAWDEDGWDEDGDDGGDDTVPFVYDANVAPGDEEMLPLLGHGSVELLGLMPWSSNGAYLVEVELDGLHAPAVYKPEEGEQPLWDFPSGLWRREVAAFELGRALGLDLVPPTVARHDAPAGPGSLQAFVPARFEHHYFTLRDDPTHGRTFRELCAFDLVANSADRKAGHCLVDASDRVWAIDNGLTFHVEFKVRTVLWDFAGEALPGELADALARFLDEGPPPALGVLLDQDEVDATTHRARALLSTARFPHDPSGRRYPWPLV